MEVSQSGATPKSSIWIGLSIRKPIDFGVPPSMEPPKSSTCHEPFDISAQHLDTSGSCRQLEGRPWRPSTKLNLWGGCRGNRSPHLCVWIPHKFQAPTEVGEVLTKPFRTFSQYHFLFSLNPTLRSKHPRCPDTTRNRVEVQRFNLGHSLWYQFCWCCCRFMKVLDSK